MWTTVQHLGKDYRADLSKPFSIAIPLREGLETVNCFYAPPMETSPVVAGDFVGSTTRGGPLNFLNVRFNPHGNGTHTECVGHIAKEPYTINQCLETFHFPALLLSVFPTKTGEGDRVIFREQLEQALEGTLPPEALIIRTLPNDELKQQTNYSGSNPPYVNHEAILFLAEKGVRHLLIDLPSVDREEDGGQLLSHRAFWSYPESPRKDCTITELIFVNNSIKDGLYLLNIMIASFELDVSPSKPVLYKLDPADPMPYYQSTYYSKIFRDFREIDAVNYRRIIRFYEAEEEAIQRLDFEEYFELIVSYVNALFEVGAYQKHLLMVDVAIEMAITHNVKRHKGEDIYHKMLFRKAASLYNILEYDKSEYILRELIKIDPYDEDTILFLQKCLRKKEPGFLNNAKAFSILLFLLAALVISVEVLFIRPFYKAKVDEAEAARTVIFLLGCAVLVGGILLHRWLVQRKIHSFVEKTRNSKIF